MVGFSSTDCAKLERKTTPALDFAEIGIDLATDPTMNIDHGLLGQSSIRSRVKTTLIYWVIREKKR
jgi:hypothetical protein